MLFAFACVWSDSIRSIVGHPACGWGPPCEAKPRKISIPFRIGWIGQMLSETLIPLQCKSLPDLNTTLYKRGYTCNLNFLTKPMV